MCRIAARRVIPSGAVVQYEKLFRDSPTSQYPCNAMRLCIDASSKLSGRIAEFAIIQCATAFSANPRPTRIGAARLINLGPETDLRALSHGYMSTIPGNVCQPIGSSCP
jgi:hypothetical protein